MSDAAPPVGRDDLPALFRAADAVAAGLVTLAALVGSAIASFWLVRANPPRVGTTAAPPPSP
jgi:hypothetical protein